MRILLTGTSGQVGGALLPRLAALGTLIAADRAGFDLGKPEGWAANRGVPLIHFSTDYVFDGSGARPWHEDDPTGPLGAYGASKLAGEAQILAARGPSLILRTSWVYAATGKNFLRTIARAARER